MLTKSELLARNVIIGFAVTMYLLSVSLHLMGYRLAFIEGLLYLSVGMVAGSLITLGVVTRGRKKI